MKKSFIAIVSMMAAVVSFESCNDTYDVPMSDIEILQPALHHAFYGVVKSTGDTIKFWIPCDCYSVHQTDVVEARNVNLVLCREWSSEIKKEITYYLER